MTEEEEGEKEEEEEETGRRRRGYGTKTTGRREEEEEEEKKTGAEKGAGAVGIGFIIICVYLIVSYHLFRLHDLRYSHI